MKEKVGNYLFAGGLCLVFLGYFMPIMGPYGTTVVFGLYREMSVLDIILSLVGILVAAFGAVLTLVPALAKMKHARFFKVLCLFLALCNGISLIVIESVFALTVVDSVAFWFTAIGLVAALVGFYIKPFTCFFVNLWKTIYSKMVAE